MGEIEEHQSAQAAKGKVPPKKETAASMFDDFYAFDEPKAAETKPKEEEKSSE